MGASAGRTKTPDPFSFIIHPGEILRADVLEPMGLTASSLARALHVPVTRINDIVRERRGITADTALRLARFLGTTAQLWMDLQATYDLKLVEQAAGKRIARAIKPVRRAA